MACRNRSVSAYAASGGARSTAICSAKQRTLPKCRHPPARKEHLSNIHGNHNGFRELGRRCTLPEPIVSHAIPGRVQAAKRGGRAVPAATEFPKGGRANGASCLLPIEITVQALDHFGLLREHPAATSKPPRKHKQSHPEDSGWADQSGKAFYTGVGVHRR